MTNHRTIQWMGIITVALTLAGGYFYWQARAGVKQGAPLAGPAASNLVGYWSFDGDDISGTTAYDRSGSGNNGTLVNSPTKTNGKLGQALLFNGTSNYTTLPNSSSLNFSAGSSFTIATWVKTSDDYGPIVSFRSSASSNPVIDVNVGFNGSTDSPGKAVVLVRDDSSCCGFTEKVSSGRIDDGQWHLVVLNRTASNIEVFIDGTSNGTATLSYAGGAITTDAYKAFGVELMWITESRGTSDQRYLEGAMDEVRVYNTALTAAQVYDLYKLGGETVGASTPTRDSLNEGLAGYWKLDDASGTTATDSSTNGNNGTLTNGPTWGTGQIGGGGVFDGTDDYINVGTAPNIANKSFTISTWTKRNTTGVAHWLISQGSGSAGNGLHFGFLSNNKVRCSFYNSAYDLDTPSFYTDSNWHLWTCTYDADSNTKKIFQDGVFLVSGTVPSDYAGSGALKVGAFLDGTTVLNGQLDEIRVYNRALSAEEITRLYKTTTPGNPDTRLKGYWSFDGDSISGTTARDLSGTGRNGTLVGSPVGSYGAHGQALSFDGGNYVDTGNYYSYSRGTAALWVKPSFGLSTSNYFHALYSTKNGGCDIFDLQFDTIANKWGFAVSGSCTYRSVYSLAVTSNNELQRWHFIVGTWDKDRGLRLYVDGVLAAESLATTGVLGHMAPTIAGNVFSNWQGAIDEFRVYDVELSASEIYNLYQEGSVKVNKAQNNNGDSLNDGLAGYWKLDDASGTTATDSSTNANNGTLTNGPTWGTGQIGGATTFDGTNDYIAVPDSTSLQAVNRFTVSVWVKPDLTSGTIAGKQVLSGFLGWTFGFGNTSGSGCSGGQIGFSFNTGWHCTTAAVVTAGSWQHLVLAYDGSNVTLYRDGTVVQTMTIGAPATTSAVLFLGNSFDSTGTPNGSYFDGQIDEFRFYNRALSAEEVSRLYKTTSPTNPETGLVGYWSFNGKDIAGTTAYDRSGRGNNGTLTNGPTTDPGKIGQALSFDGSDDYVSMGTPSSLTNLGAMTFSAWIKPTISGVSEWIIVDKGNNTGTGWVLKICSSFGVCGGGWEGLHFFRGFTLANGEWKSATHSIVSNQWQHVVVTFAGSSSDNPIFYVNGTVSATTESIAPNGSIDDDSATTLRIGRTGSGAPFNGAMDEVRLYNRVLSATEIANLYNFGR